MLLRDDSARVPSCLSHDLICASLLMSVTFSFKFSLSIGFTVGLGSPDLAAISWGGESSEVTELAQVSGDP